MSLPRAICFGAVVMAALATTAPVVGAAPTNPAGIAVIIGNRDYSGIPNVAYAINDALAFKAYVIDVLGFDPLNVYYLPNASKANLEAVFGSPDDHKGWLWQNVPADQADVVVFYSGHGVPRPDDRRSFLVPVDANAATPWINGYALEVLYANLAMLEARTVAVFLDACFSGTSFGGLVGLQSSGIGVVPTAVGTRIGVLTAAGGGQVAVWDDESRHGLFTRHLLEGLHGEADAAGIGDGDGRVTLAEAKKYLDSTMTRAERRKGIEQSATLLGEAGLEFAALSGARSARTPADLLVETKVVATTQVPVRVGPATTAELVAVIDPGQTVVVLDKHDYWYQVRLPDGRTGFAVEALFDNQVLPAMIQPPPAAVAARPVPSPARALYAKGPVNVRAGPATDAELIVTLDDGAAVTEVGRADYWIQVGLPDGRRGFVLSALLSESPPARPRL